VAFSPDGKVLARSSYAVRGNQASAVEVRRRDLTKDKDLPPLANTVSKAPLNCLAFAPDGQTLAGSDYAGYIILWDTASGKVRSTLKEEGERRVSAVAFAPDGKTLAAAVGDRPGRDHEPGYLFSASESVELHLAGR
jgi:WD40 repeat protein